MKREGKSIEEIRHNVIHSPDYRFIKTNIHLQGEKHLKVLGLGGSYAYGIETPTSDIDLRGIATYSRDDILLGRTFDAVHDTKTDTMVYSANKFVELLLNNKVNALEILGLHLSQIVYADFDFLYGLKNLEKDILSKKVIKTYGGYINSLRSKISTEKDPVKLSKVLANILRLYYTGIDILQNCRVVTFRKDERYNLLEIRKGKYVDSECNIKEEFFVISDMLEKDFERLVLSTRLPDVPNSDRVYGWLKSINEDVVLGRHG